MDAIPADPVVIGGALIHWLQSFHPALDAPMAVLGGMIRPEFFIMVLVPVIYWTVSPRHGWWLLAALCLDLALGEALRVALAAPRPFWVDSAILGLDDVTSIYSSPSGYASSGAVLFGALAAWSGRGWAWVVAVALVLLTCTAKLYHGATALDHVALGLVEGALVLWALLRWLPASLEPRFDGAGTARRAVALIALAVALWLVNALVLALHQDAVLPAAYAQYKVVAADRLANGGALFASVILLGFGLGHVFTLARGGFEVAGTWWRRALRVVVGLPPAVVLFGPLRSIAGNAIPEAPGLGDDALLALVNLAFGLAAFGWVSGLAPRAFRALRLA